MLARISLLLNIGMYMKTGLLMDVCILYRHFSKQTIILCLVCVCVNKFQIVSLVQISSEYINIYVFFWLDIHLGNVSILTCFLAHNCMHVLQKLRHAECLEIYHIRRQNMLHLGKISISRRYNMLHVCKISLSSEWIFCWDQFFVCPFFLLWYIISV